MLKIKTSTRSISEDYIALERQTGVAAISSRHLIGILSICVFSVILALPYGKLIPAASSPLLSVFNAQRSLSEQRRLSYLAASEEESAGNVEIAAPNESLENYYDLDLPSHILPQSVLDYETAEVEDSRTTAPSQPLPAGAETEIPLRPRFQSVPLSPEDAGQVLARVPAEAAAADTGAAAEEAEGPVLAARVPAEAAAASAGSQAALPEAAPAAEQSAPEPREELTASARESAEETRPDAAGEVASAPVLAEAAPSAEQSAPEDRDGLPAAAPQGARELLAGEPAAPLPPAAREDASPAASGPARESAQASEPETLVASAPPVGEAPGAPAAESAPAPAAGPRPQGTWYQQTVRKGDSLSEIFEYLDLPFATLSKITGAADSRDLLLVIGEKLQFLIDGDNIVLEFVKPVDKDTQARFTRLKPDESFAVVHEKIGSHLTDPALAADFPEASEMPRARLALAERARQAELLAQAKAEQQARAAQAEKELARRLETRPRLVLGELKAKESFDAAAARAGLTKSEIATIKTAFGGRLNFKQLKAGDSFRMLTDGIGTKANITAVEISSAKNGKVALYRNPANKQFYEEGGYHPAAGAFKRFPLNGKITISSQFNPKRKHPIRKVVVPHWGVDFKVSVGTPVYAPADGTVKFAGFMRGGGYVVILDHKNGYSTVYMHLSRFDVKKGQSVSMGQVIAKSGNTGVSTGAHLHYELHINGRAVDPLKAELPSANAASASALRQQFESTVAALKSDLYKNSLAAAAP